MGERLPRGGARTYTRMKYREGGVTGFGIEGRRSVQQSPGISWFASAWVHPVEV